MSGISVAEYIRRRRLSQAAFDIQKGNERIIDIALKYGYESQPSFTRAFKELHGTTPSSAQKINIALKAYPPISFVLTIKGVNELNYRIEEKESFQIMGLSGYESEELVEWKPGKSITPLWKEFVDKYMTHVGNFETAPFWQVGAYWFQSNDGKTKAVIGAEYKGEKPVGIEVSVETIPAATWAVFTIRSSTGNKEANAAISRVVTEWFPASQYKRNKDVPFLDVYPWGDVNSEDYLWELWFPVLDK